MNEYNVIVFLAVVFWKKFFFFTGHRIAFNYGSSGISELWLSSVHASCQLSDAVWIPVLHHSLNVSQVMVYNH